MATEPPTGKPAERKQDEEGVLPVFVEKKEEYYRKKKDESGERWNEFLFVFVFVL